MSRPIFAFLALEEHPYAREMLRQLLESGHAPAIIVEERSEVADQEREKFLIRIQGNPLAPTIAEQAEANSIPVKHMPIHRSAPLLELLGGRPLDLIVLGGTRILRGPILSYPRDGVINSHPGLLPDCRGSASVAWSLVHDIQVGSTTHFCNEGIDTGDLLLRRALPVRHGMTYEDLCYGTLVLAGVLMREALVAYDEGRWSQLRSPQVESPWPTFKNAPDEVIAHARQRLADGTYAHFVD